LQSYKSKLHNITDIENEKRAVRAIEIEQFYADSLEIDTRMPELNSLVVGIKYDRLSRRKRITQRLQQRLDEGMVDEVRRLLDSGLSPDNLVYYGLEYKYITQHLMGDLTFDQMVEKLNTAIHQFAKRQMTWFRRMERMGANIHWLDGYQPLEEKIDRVMTLLERTLPEEGLPYFL
jgi:tRNA dimethylallyltransferase